MSEVPVRYRSPYRTEAERLDASIADSELRAAGVIEDDEPTEYSHDAYMRAYDQRAFGEFTPEERFALRSFAGLLAASPSSDGAA
jgi:hypothetical protein